MIVLYVILYIVCSISTATFLYNARKKGGLWVTRTIFVIYVIFSPITLTVRAIYLLFVYCVYTPLALFLVMIMALGEGIISTWKWLERAWQVFDWTHAPTVGQWQADTCHCWAISTL